MFEFLSEIGTKAWGFLAEAVKKEISFEEYYNSITKLYPEYDEFHARLDYLRTEQQFSWWKEMDSVADNEAFGRDYFAPAKTPTPARYMITARVHGFNENTMQYEDRFISIGSDNLLTKENWKNAINEAFKKSEMRGSARFNIENINFVKAWRGW